MTTSTSKKLYGFLKGYESACFTGSTVTEVTKSYRLLLFSESYTLSSRGLYQLSTDQINSLTRDINKFLCSFYRRITNGSSDSYYKKQADNAKEDSKVLSRVLSNLFQGSKQSLEEIAICPCNSQGICNIITLSDHGECIYYLNHKFCMLMAPNDVEEVSNDFIAFHLPEYRYLALSLIRLSAILLANGISIDNLIDYQPLFELTLSISKIFELMNPNGSVRQSYLDDAKELLTQSHLNYESEDYRSYLSILYSVFEDIKEGKKRYIKDLYQSLIIHNDYIHSKYNPKLDAYYSMKSSAQSPFTGEKFSLLSSLYEIDPYKDLFSNFDNFIGYSSPYESDVSQIERITPRSKYFDEEGQEIHPTSVSIRTILINNPGKFKPRIIHIGDNPLQDRCNYIHKRLQTLLNGLKCDCTRNQEIGRDFLKNLTMEWYVSPPEKRKGIYGADFSNATDTLDQKFQWEVLNFIFGQEVANFWSQVSQLPKYIIDIQGNYHNYSQSCGQPQGLLGSFMAFALAHHFIFLMDMKQLGLENYSSTEFYRVLGDDSVYNSIVPERDQYAEDAYWLDNCNIRRSLTEEVHMKTCERFAGFKVNYDKSESIHHDSLEAKLDFAKVTFRNGSLATPIPFRLVMKCSKSVNDQIAIAIWKSDRDDPNCRAFMESIYPSLDTRTVNIIKSGEIPFLGKFKDPIAKFNESYLARIRYCSSMAVLMATLALSSLQDKDRDYYASEITLDKVIEDFFNKKSQKFTQSFIQRIDKVNPNHKFFAVLEDNEEIMNLYHEIFNYEEQDVRILALATSTIGDFIQGDFFDDLYQMAQTSKIIGLAKANPNVNVSEVFPDFGRNHFKQLKQLVERMVTRGIARKPSEEAVVLQKIIDFMSDLDETLGEIQDPVTYPA